MTEKLSKFTPDAKSSHDAATEKLLHSEERFRLLVEGVRDYAIYMLDPDGFVNSWNSGAERIKGYRAEEIIGKHFSCFFRPEDRAAGLPQRALQVAAREGEYSAESLRVRKDGSSFWASILITALRDSEGTLRGFSKVVRDITESKEAERKLQEKQRLANLGITSAVFAHEIANPLNGISTSLQIVHGLLKKTDFSKEMVLETLKGAHEEVERLAALLQDYREIARPQHLRWEAVDLDSTVREVLAPATLSYNKLGIIVDFQRDEELSLVNADKEKIKQVILNICKNAVEAMPEGGTLTIKAYELDERVNVEISDNGIGIPENLDVFQIFKTTKPEGTGLGLAIVQQIVSDHHGAVSYVSEPGKGTTFTISLPASRSTHQGGKGALPPSA
jgi:PAS domain S-box-containing protein